MAIISIKQGGTGVDTLNKLKSTLNISNVDNTSDANKILSSNPIGGALALLAPKANPVFTGTANITSTSDAVLQLETTEALNTSFRRKMIYSSTNVGNGNDWLFRSTRPSDGLSQDIILAGNGPNTSIKIWTSGNFNPANDGTRIYAAYYGVVSNSQVDQAAAIMNAINSLPVTGGIVVLPAGNIYIGQTIVSNRQNVIIEGAGRYATFIVGLSNWTTGDMITLNGNYSIVRDLGFYQQPSGSTTLFRTSGFTINMAGAYQDIYNVSIRHCYIAIRMGLTAGAGHVDKVDITYMSTDANTPGSGGIVIDNPNYGPSNRISNCLIYGDSGSTDGSVTQRPAFGIQIINSGATLINTLDVLGFKVNLRIDTPTGKTCQAFNAINCYFDSAQENNILIVASGTGFIFDVRFTQCWITNTISSGSNGIHIVNSNGATGNNNRPVMGVKFINGFIVSTAPSPGTGVLINEPLSSDTVILNCVISGWNIGVNIGSNVNHVKVIGNSIGRYGPFGIQTNDTGIALTAGTGNWLMVKDNTLYANTTNQLLNQGPTGANNMIKDNLGV